MKYEAKALKTYYKTWQPAMKRLYTLRLWARVSDAEVSENIMTFLRPAIVHRKIQRAMGIIRLNEPTNNPEAS